MVRGTPPTWMTQHDRPGLFLNFEGLDGSGFEHHAAALARLLSREGYRVVLTEEPTKSLIGGLIRARIAGEWEIAPETLQLLFTQINLEMRCLESPHADGGIDFKEEYGVRLRESRVESPEPGWIVDQ